MEGFYPLLPPCQFISSTEHYMQSPHLSAMRYKLLWMSKVNLWYYSAVNGPPCYKASNTPGNDCSDSRAMGACVRHIMRLWDHLAACHMVNALPDCEQDSNSNNCFFFFQSKPHPATHTYTHKHTSDHSFVAFVQPDFKFIAPCLHFSFLQSTTNTAYKKWHLMAFSQSVGRALGKCEHALIQFAFIKIT